MTIEGVDVGGMDADDAEAKVRRALLRPLDRPLRTVYRERTWVLPAAKLNLHADVGAAVREAVSLSREGDLPTRLGRYLGGDQLEVVASRPGRKLRDVRLTRELNEAVVGDAPRTVTAHVHETAPDVTTKEVAARYPSYLTLDRANFTLRLWKDLELARTYTVAVGREGLETPEGTYAIEWMEENPTWHVPESDWAGDLAGQTIPPGPENPIKARWMAIYEGAGIHGTEETASLGSAASHGCVRMSIPDVEELYDEVEVGTPVFIG